MTKSRSKDQMIYALLAVLFGAVAVIFVRGIAQNRFQLNSPKVVLGAKTANELMMELSKTTDDGGQVSIVQLKKDAGGL